MHYESRPARWSESFRRPGAGSPRPTLSGRVQRLGCSLGCSADPGEPERLCRLSVGVRGNAVVVTTTPEQSRQRRQQEEALESGELYQDAEGDQTTDPTTAAEHADSEAKRNAEHLERGETGPGIPEK
jgi:hypothetical protein